MIFIYLFLRYPTCRPFYNSELLLATEGATDWTTSCYHIFSAAKTGETLGRQAGGRNHLYVIKHLESCNNVARKRGCQGSFLRQNMLIQKDLLHK